MIDVDKYLERLNVTYPIEANKDGLFRLQKAHLLNVPFENLDIHYGVPIVLDTQRFYHKIVENRRGGFCYELNGLFNQLLNSIGFESKLVSARTFGKDQKYSPEYDHMALVVTLDGLVYLVDVGFGRFSLEPLPIIIDEVQSDKYGQFTFDNSSSSSITVNEINDGKPLPQYSFSLEEKELSAFKERCDFHQQSSESHFTQKKVISVATDHGRVTLNNTQLKIAHIGKEEVTNFKEEEFEFKLREWFGIEL